MGNSLRCCLACFVPCGALDVIRIVHLNGHVEEVGHPISVKEVMIANPNHILTRPCSQGLTHTILILSPNSELKRGRIYFLIPASAIPNYKFPNNNNSKGKMKQTASSSSKPTASSENSMQKGLPRKKVSHRRHRRCQAGQLGIWRPNLESICED